MKRINLKFDNTINRIAGNDYGKEIYNTQVKPIIKESLGIEKYEIFFPETIIAVANSFVQGFISDISKYIVPELFYNYFSIEGSEELKKDFMEGIID
ncbi:MAG: hypothetical protein HXL16_02370 [Peptostreptococcaceae bacterium]|nr:hypothetical protein [Peptostreptococcaceae bacterium]